MQTKGVRPRPDQIEALEQLMELDPELDWSKAVRRGLDLFLQERAAQLRAQVPLPPRERVPVFRSITMPPSREATATPSAVHRRLAETPPRSDEVSAPSEPKS